MKIPIIIPHYKAQESLAKTIEALQKQAYCEVEIFIRDNSVDNILWTKAVNEGLRKYCFNNNFKYCLILNQDAILEPDALSIMVNAMEENEKIGICTPTIINSFGKVSCGMLDAYPWGTGIVYSKDNYPKLKFETYWATGACMLIRSEMVKEIGLFDENMEFICSDCDFSFTAKSRGYIVVVEPLAIVHHTSSGSSNSDVDSPLNLIKWKDQLYFGKKWISGDLYKSLSYEGKHLTNDFILEKINFSIKQIEFFKKLHINKKDD